MVNVKVNQKKYMKKLRRFTIIFLEKERPLYEYLQTKEERGKYLKQLMEEDMAKHK